jgi:hypothetical protein
VHADAAEIPAEARLEERPRRRGQRLAVAEALNPGKPGYRLGRLGGVRRQVDRADRRLGLEPRLQQPLDAVIAERALPSCRPMC